jgi:hypothetical protein
LSQALEIQLDGIRARIARASRETVLEDESFVFRGLTNLLSWAGSRASAVEALYDMRQS